MRNAHHLELKPNSVKTKLWMPWMSPYAVCTSSLESNVQPTAKKNLKNLPRPRRSVGIKCECTLGESQQQEQMTKKSEHHKTECAIRHA